MTRGGNESLYKRKLFDACQGGDIEALKRLLPVEDINVTWDRKEDGVEFWHGDAPLHAAARYGRKGTVEVLLECGADVNKKNRHQQTALHLASQWGDADLVQTLINHNADVHAADEKYCTPLHHARSSAVVDVLVKQDAELDARDRKGNTPLHLAAERGKTDLVNCFIECKADFQARNNAGNTPLHLAEKKDVVELLLHHGVDVHALNYTGMTPLHYACLHGRVSAARTLLSHGANIDAAVSWKSQQPIKPAASRVKRYQAQFSDQNYLTMYDGQTPLHLACYGEHYETVDLLLQHGANINATDSGKNTPLHVAAGEAGVKDKIINREKAVRLLLDSKSDIHAKNHRGWTPLHVASLRNRSDAVKLLLLFGADVRATDNLGRTPLHLVHSADDISRELWTNCLIRNYSFLVQSLEMDGLLEECLRHEVLSHEQFQFIKDSSTQYEKARSFLDMLWRIDSRHYLPFLRLLKQNQPDLASVLEEDFRLSTSIIYILLSINADPSARDLNGATPLHSASHHGFTSVAQILIQEGAKVNATDKRGRTPLHYACRKCQLKTAQLLLKKGAGMEVVDHEGNTPLSLAAAGKCTQLCQVLMRSGATSGISTLVLNADIGADLESVVKNIKEKSRQAPMRVWDDQGVICETREKLITRSGGKIELHDVTIWVPPNALTRPAFLSVTHRDYALIRQRKIQAAGLEDLLQPVMQMELQPHGLKFQHPVHLEMKKFQLGNDGSLLVFHKEMGIHEDASWMDITSDCKTNFRKHDVVLALSHFSAIEILGAVCATGMVLGGLTVTACALGLLNNRFAACEFSAFHEPIKACLKIIAKVQINEDNNELSPSTDFFGAGVTNCCLIDKQNLRFYPGSTGERSEFPFFLDQCMQRGQIFRVPVSADGINDLPSCIYIRRAKILGEQDICKVRRRTIRSEMTSKRQEARQAQVEARCIITELNLRDKWISANKDTLVKYIQTQYGLLERLVSNDVITDEEEKAITGEGTGYKIGYEQSKELIKIIRKVDHRKYLTFLEVLGDRQADLAKLLKKDTDWRESSEALLKAQADASSMKSS